MPKPSRPSPFLPPGDALFTVKPRKVTPHAFVLEALAPLAPETRMMFGCLAVYVGDQIVLALRDKGDHLADNGV
jgi:hypothetical protein